MTPDLTAELEQFVDEVIGGAHAGEPWSQRGLHIVQQGIDVVAAAIVTFDAENLEADLAFAGAKVAAAAIRIADHFLADRPLQLITARRAIAFFAPSAVVALGVYAPRVQEFKDAVALPLAVGGEGFFRRIREALGG